jgi:ceramide glucosyltransferase
MSMSQAVLIASGLLWGASLLWLLGSMTCALLQPWKRKRAELSPGVIPGTPVSIIVPTSAADTPRAERDRAEAMGSLLALNHPDYEIVLCVDRAEQGRDLVARLLQSYRDRRVHVMAARHQSSANAKIDAMEAAVGEARHELLLFSDDDVLVDSDHVLHLRQQMHDAVGLVSAAAIGIRPTNFGGYLELAFMNGQFARLHLAGDFLGFSGALGKTILVERGGLRRAGGLLRTGGDCCEDAALTANFKAAGMKVALSSVAVRQPILEQSFSDVWRRHVRWLGCRRKYLTIVFICEGLFSTPVAAAAAAVACSQLSWGPAAGAAGCLLMWCAADALFTRLSGWHFGLRTPAAWLVREAIFLPMWMQALATRAVTWHGRRVPLTLDERPATSARR